jgi:hypothetical protein
VKQIEKAEVARKLGMIVPHIGILGAVDWVEEDRSTTQDQESIAEMDIAELDIE